MRICVYVDNMLQSHPNVAFTFLIVSGGPRGAGAAAGAPRHVRQARAAAGVRQQARRAARARAGAGRLRSVPIHISCSCTLPQRSKEVSRVSKCVEFARITLLILIPSKSSNDLSRIGRSGRTTHPCYQSY